MLLFREVLRSLKELYLDMRNPVPTGPRLTISQPIANLGEIEIPGTGRYIDLDSTRPHLALDVPETSLHIRFGPEGERFRIYEAVVERPTSSLARTLHRLSLEGRVQRYTPKTSRVRSTSLISASPLYYDASSRPTTPDDLVESRQPRLVDTHVRTGHSVDLGAGFSRAPPPAGNPMAYITRPRRDTYRDSCTLPGGFHNGPAQRNAPVYNSARAVEHTDAMSTGAYSTVINDSYHGCPTAPGAAHPGAGEYYCSARGRPATPGVALLATAPDDEGVSASTVGGSGTSTSATSIPTATTTATTTTTTTPTSATTATTATPTHTSRAKKIKLRIKGVAIKLRNKCRSRR